MFRKISFGELKIKCSNLLEHCKKNTPTIVENMKSNTAIYDFFESNNNKIKSTGIFLLRIISPTWWYADRVKSGLNPQDRMKGIVTRNYAYLGISIFFTLIYWAWHDKNELQTLSSIMYYIAFGLVYLIQWSRCNEIFIAFIRDALDKSEVNTNRSTLTYRKRIELALLSYCELILNYSIIYLVMPSSWFTKEGFNHVFDSIYFSGVTITTLGYGDLSPTHFIPKMLVIHEVLVGFTLIIVSFALYAGKAPNEQP